MNDASLEATRLLRLEEKVAYQDKTIAELDEVVVRLSRLAGDLERRLAVLERALPGDLAAREMPNEKPPHY
ncbi:MAG TPA: SlyX family protein [Polyangiaceae bacterium]|jgi:uncharacterized coiled-coil protein SlyX